MTLLATVVAASRQVAATSARVKRYRPGKDFEHADTFETVRKIFAAQSSG